MRAVYRPHVLGVDDGPFEKHRSDTVPVVGVMMEGHDLVEAVAVTRFPVDGEEATGFLRDWISKLRFRPALQGIVLGGVTIAGLGVVDAEELARGLGVPVLIVNRRDPARHRLRDAFEAAGLPERLEVVERTPEAFALPGGLFVAAAGADREQALRMLHATRGKSDLPEPLRLAHLIAAAVASGQSRGRP